MRKSIKVFRIFAILTLVLPLSSFGEECDVEMGFGPPLAGEMKVRSHFGSRTSSKHRGIDIYAAPGTAIQTIGDGYIVDAQNSKSKLGGLVVVSYRKKLSDGTTPVYRAVYAHLQREGVKSLRKQLLASPNKRIRISKGVTIPHAKTGQTGNAHGQPLDQAHLHLELVKNCKYSPTSSKCHPTKVDPWPCIDANKGKYTLDGYEAEYFGPYIYGGRSVAPVVYVIKEGSPPPGAELQFFIDNKPIGKVAIDQEGYYQPPAVRLPNVWTRDVKFRVRLTQSGHAAQEREATVEVRYDWRAVKKGWWSVDYQYSRTSYATDGSLLTRVNKSGQGSFNVNGPGGRRPRRPGHRPEYYDIGSTEASLAESFVKQFGDSCASSASLSLDEGCVRLIISKVRRDRTRWSVGVMHIDEYIDVTANCDVFWNSTRDVWIPKTPGCFIVKIGELNAGGGGYTNTVDPVVFTWTSGYDNFQSTSTYQTSFYPSGEDEWPIFTYQYTATSDFGHTDYIFKAVREPDIPPPPAAKNTVGQPLAESGMTRNYPNPFNPTTKIEFSLDRSQFVSLSVFNILGQRVEQLHDGTLGAGLHSFTWDGSRYASGVYLYRITASDFVETKKMLLLK